MNIPAAKIHFPEEDKKEILKNISNILKMGRLTLGKFGRTLEKEFSSKHQTKFGVTVSSGTASLEIALRILDIEHFEVIVPSNTFFATPASVIHAGGRPVFVDMKNDLLGPSLDQIKRVISKKTKVVIVVHIGGIINPGIHLICEWCKKHDISVIEDAAHAHGSSFDGKMAGSFGDLGSFSFYPTKVITSAEGGILLTNNEFYAGEAKIFRDQGKAGFLENHHIRLGYNWRMSEIHAVIGLSQLRRLEHFVERRRAIARLYDQELGKIDEITPVRVHSKVLSNYYKYIAILDRDINRSYFKARLREEYQVHLSGEVYDLPCHLQPVFSGLGYAKGDFPRAEEFCQRHVCLPISAQITREEAQYVTKSIRSILD